MSGSMKRANPENTHVGLDERLEREGNSVLRQFRSVSEPNGVDIGLISCFDLCEIGDSLKIQD